MKVLKFRKLDGFPKVTLLISTKIHINFLFDTSPTDSKLKHLSKTQNHRQRETATFVLLGFPPTCHSYKNIIIFDITTTELFEGRNHVYSALVYF